MDIGQKLREIRESKNLTLEKVAEKMGRSVNYVAMKERGERKIDFGEIAEFAKALDVSPNQILKLEVEFIPSKKLPLSPPTLKLPDYGEIPCGRGLFKDDNIEGYKEVTWTKKGDFVVRAKGDSMRDLGIVDGTYVAIRKQDTCKNGQIALVSYCCENGEWVTTLKKFIRTDSKVILLSANDQYKEIRARDVRVIGIAVDIYKEINI